MTLGTKHPLGSPSRWTPQLTGSSRLDGSGETQVKISRCFGSRPPPVVFPSPAAPSAAPAAAQGCSTRGYQALAASQAPASPSPRSPRRAQGRQQTPISCLRSARDESPQFSSSVLSVSWKRRRAGTLARDFGKRGGNCFSLRLFPFPPACPAEQRFLTLTRTHVVACSPPPALMIRPFSPQFLHSLWSSVHCYLLLLMEKKKNEEGWLWPHCRPTT